ncbi:hypothetical protein [Flavobacterium aciduliphilum]|uniref:Uncharacterized protein n=1 Tax=Flavobacterium aciduliphilum TaxID=1101402 RepID=A0A328YDR7_9FLAO|nr:hypothetical protein [Flavobacterium aciduliphilum]RAR71364.1 hypothetical protein CLV55_108101 [Flavobacterium aciduliphilum]
MESKTLKIKSKKFDKSDLIYLTDNNSYVEFIEPVNILDVSFNIEILSNINSIINLKIQLSSELRPKNFFLTNLKFNKNKTNRFLNLREIIEKSENFQQYSDTNIQFVSIETDSDIDIDLKLTF